jgi:hypothetical protein
MASRSTPKVIASQELKLRILQARKEGTPFKDIAEAEGVSISYCYKVVWNHLEAIKEESQVSVDALRKEADDRFRALLEAVWERALSGDLAAVEQAAKLQDRLDKLHGVQAPAKSEVVNKVERLSADELRSEARKLGIYQFPDEITEVSVPIA